MKKNLLILAVLVSCTTPEKPSKVTPPKTSGSTTSGTPATVSSSTGSTATTAGLVSYKVPALSIPENSNATVKEALALFHEHSQSEEFYSYVRKTVKTLAGGNETDVERAIQKTRECFNRLGPIQIKWRNYGVWPVYKSAAIGGWSYAEQVIYQNPRKLLNSIERAGHWYHELTHACKFSHISNNINTHPIIRKSWPYQSGYAFEDYVIEKRRAKVELAGE